MSSEQPQPASVEATVVQLPSGVKMRIQEDGSIVVLGDFIHGESSISLDSTGNLKAMDFITGSTFSIKGNSIIAPKYYHGEEISGTIDDSLLFSLDFTNNAGFSSNVVSDSIGNLRCTLVNVSHNGTDGYLDGRGLQLTKTGYVSIPTNEADFINKVDYSKGLTFELVSYNTNGIYFRTENSGFLAYNGYVRNNYITNSNTTKNNINDSFWFSSQYKNQSNRSLADVKNPSADTNVIVVRIYPNGQLDVSVNGWLSVTKNSSPVDFMQLTNLFSSSPLYLRRNYTETNTDDTIIHSFSIFNKVLSDNEILTKYEQFKRSEPLRQVNIYPSQVTLEEGESRSVAVLATPSQFTPLLNNTFDSLNYGYVTVDQNGVLNGVYSGDTQISVTSRYGNQEFINFIPVSVGTSIVTPPTSNRSISGISLNRIPETIEVGESFPAMATTLPFDVFDDNVTVWESSNPEVCTVNFGVIKGMSTGTSTITALDGTKTYSKSFTVTVENLIVVEPTEAETYYVPISSYGIMDNETNSIATTLGIQSALDYASVNGYKKIVFPYGNYLINPDAKEGLEIIYLPTNMIVDFNESIIKIDANSKTLTTGYSMFVFENVEYTKLINAHIYGETDRFPIVTEPNEGCMSVLIKNAYKSGLEDCTISKSVGFNIATHSQRIYEDESGRHPSKDNWEAGNINDITGQIDNSVTTNHFRNKSYLNVSNLKETYQLGYSQGYFGYPYLRSRLYSIYFYDANYNFIVAHKYNLQFYNYKTPSNVKYAKIVIYQEAAPTAQDSDFNAVAMLRSWHMPTKCFIRNCRIEDNKSTGIAMTGGQGWVIENNTFARNAGRMPACDIDWEDGWEGSVGDVCRGNTFNSPSGIIVSGVSNIAIYDNTFNYSHLHIWARTANWKVYNNFFNGKGYDRNLNIGAQADSYFAKNFMKNVTYVTPVYQHTGANYRIRISDNTQL